MKTFNCDKCDQTLYFENDVCTNCGGELAFVPELGALHCVRHPKSATSHDPAATFRVGSNKTEYRHCANRLDYAACNWAVRADRGQGARCESCALNDMVPDLSDGGNLARWIRLEVAKRRLLWALHRLALPYAAEGQLPGLRFRFLASTESEPQVMTGHENGLITINIDEADPACREATRLELGERYRTPLGHFRHESGHFYWDRLIAPVPERLESFRKRFGDEREDYQEALKRHYAADKSSGPGEYITTYAASHPWEDFAESWAHYLHMVDTLETAQTHGLVAKKLDLAAGANFDEMLIAWQRLSVTLNSLSRSIGVQDPYPFAPGEAALEKVRFVHDLITDFSVAGAGQGSGSRAVHL